MEEEPYNLDEYELLIHHGNYMIKWPRITIQHKTNGNIYEILIDRALDHFNIEKIDHGNGSVTIRQKQAGSSQQIQEQSSKKKDAYVWSTGESKALLDKMHQYFTEVGPMKRFSSKRQMYEQIAQELSAEFKTSITYLQIENRYKHLAKLNKKRIENNRISGNVRTSTLYDEEFDRLATVDSSIDPYILTQNEEIEGNTAASSRIDEPEQKSSPKTKSDKFLHFFKENQELRAQEREDRKQEKDRAKQEQEKARVERHNNAQALKNERHKEKMSAFNRLIDVLSNTK